MKGVGILITIPSLGECTSPIMDTLTYDLEMIENMDIPIPSGYIFLLNNVYKLLI